MKSFSALAAISISALSFVPSALAHGRLRSVTIDGQVYEGPQISNSGNIQSVIRTINDVSPVLDVNSDNMSCGQGAANTKAPLSADAKAGSKIDFSWASGEASVPWPHNVGPMMTYIASCGGDCADFNSADAKWVKIDEAGREGNQPEGDWIQATTVHVNKSYSMKLPDSLPAGNYLMRHEIIALHNAQSQGLAEFYPSCVQLNVSGGSSKAAFPSDTVSFPGAYSATDPGILINVYDPTTQAYPFPGPNLAFTSDSTSSNGNNSGDNNNNNGGTSNSSSATKTTTLTSATATKTKATSASPAPTDAASSDNQGSDCNDANSGSNDNNSGSNDNNSGSNDNNSSNDSAAGGDDVVTVTRTVFVNPTDGAVKHTRTATDVVTVTTDAANTQATSTPAADTGDYRPKRRSRVMRRVHF